MAEKNVVLTIENIHTQGPILHELAIQGKIDIVAARYEVESGKVEFIK